MPNKLHKDLVLDDVHTGVSKEYADEAARTADTDFQVAANINKFVRVDSPLSIFVLTSVGPPVFLELTTTLTSSFLGLSDTPGSYASQALKAVIVNAAGNALEFSDVPNENIATANLNFGVTGFVNRFLCGETGSFLQISLNDTDRVNFQQRSNFFIANDQFRLQLQRSPGGGQGNIDAEKTIVVSLGSMLITDSISSKGLEYAANYVSNFNDRSLVDKAFVESIVQANIFTADGTFTGNRNAVGENNTVLSFRMHDTNSASFGFRSLFTIQPSQIDFVMQDDTGPSLLDKRITINNSQMLINDSISMKGLEYFADYSSNFIDRSLVDKAFVDAAVANAPNISNSNLTFTPDGFATLLTGQNNSAFIINLHDLLRTNFNQRSTLGMEVQRLVLAFEKGSSGTIISTKEIRFNFTQMLVTDSTSLKGLQYAADYSGNFDLRSLVDKNYVDTHPGTTGNIYTVDGIIAPAGQIRDIQGNSNSAIIFKMTDLISPLFNAETRFAMTPTSLSLALQIGNGGTSLVSQKNIGINESAMSITDTKDSKGLEYVADYSAAFLINDRSIVDKAFIDTAIATAGNIYTIDGTIAPDTTARAVTGNNGSALNIVMHDTVAATFAFRSTLRMSQDRLDVGLEKRVPSSNKRISFTTTQMLVIDEFDQKGLEYEANYSSQFLDRSIVDKAFIEGLVANAPTIFLTNGTIFPDATTRILTGNGNSNLQFSIHDLTLSNFNARSVFLLRPTEVFLSLQFAAAAVISGEKKLIFNPTQMLVTDTQTSKGLEYAADYAGNFTDRSLVDKAFVADRGSMSVASNSSQTTFVTLGFFRDFIVSSPIFQVGTNNAGWTLTNTTTGEMTYTGKATRDFAIFAWMLLQKTASPAATTQYKFRLLLNDLPLTLPEATDLFAVVNSLAFSETTIPMFVRFRASTGDKVRWQVANQQNLEDLQITNFNQVIL